MDTLDKYKIIFNSYPLKAVCKVNCTYGLKADINIYYIYPTPCVRGSIPLLDKKN